MPPIIKVVSSLSFPVFSAVPYLPTHIIYPQRELQLQCLSLTGSSVFSLLHHWFGRACGPPGVGEFVLFEMQPDCSTKNRLVSHEHLEQQEGPAWESQMKTEGAARGRNIDWVN